GEDRLELPGRRLAHLPVIDRDRAEGLSVAADDRARPARADLEITRDVHDRLPLRVLLDVGNDLRLPGERGGPAARRIRPDPMPLDEIDERLLHACRSAEM